MHRGKELHDQGLTVVLLNANVLPNAKLLAHLNSLSKVGEVLLHVVRADAKLIYYLRLVLGQDLIEDLFLKDVVEP